MSLDSQHAAICALLRILLACKFFADRLMRGLSRGSLLKSHVQRANFVVARGSNLGIPRRGIFRILSGHEYVRDAAP